MLTPSSTAPSLRIAIFRTSSLGDVVLATSCINMLSALPFPVEIFWIGRSASLDMVKRSWPQLNAIDIPQGSTISTLQEIIEKLQHIHFVIDLQCNLRSRWLCRNLKVTKGIPFFEAPKLQILRNRLLFEARFRGRRRPLAEQAQKATFFQYQLMSQTLLQGLRQQLPPEFLDPIENKDFPPKLPIPDSFDPPWRKELRFGSWLAIAPGAAHPTKQAPLALLIAIISRMVNLSSTARFATSPEKPSVPLNPPKKADTIPFGLVFLGDAKDREMARRIIDSLGWEGPLLNLAGKLTLWENAGALREASALLANDSSLAHIAEAVDTPVAVLFGPTIESFGFAPRMPQSQAFSASIGCRPCSKHGMVSCRYGDHLCFMALDPGKVADHLLHLLAAKDLGTSSPRSGPLPRNPFSPEDIV